MRGGAGECGPWGRRRGGEVKPAGNTHTHAPAPASIVSVRPHLARDPLAVLDKIALAARLLAELANLTDPEERKAMMARIADVQLRQAMAEEARRAFLRG